MFMGAYCQNKLRIFPSSLVQILARFSYIFFPPAKKESVSSILIGEQETA